MRSASAGCGGGEIRTHEAFRPSGFQDRRDQPLCHPSEEPLIRSRKLITPLRQYSKRNQAAVSNGGLRLRNGSTAGYVHVNLTHGSAKENPPCHRGNAAKSRARS